MEEHTSFLNLTIWKTLNTEREKKGAGYRRGRIVELEV